MKSLKEEWQEFFKIILGPLVVVLILVTIVFDVVLVAYSNSLFASSGGIKIEIVLITVLTVITSLASGISGGVLSKKWDELTGEKVITARGKSAVRSLKLLLRGIVALEKRVQTFLERHSDEGQTEGQNTEVVNTYLEEVIQRCVRLEEEAIGSIEDWTDIVPGSDITTQIGRISELLEEREKHVTDIQRLSIEAEEGGKSKEEVQTLRTFLQQKENELTSVQMELEQRRRDLSNGLDFELRARGNETEKWADYGIARVEYDDERSHIVKVEVREDTGDRIGPADVWARSQVVSAIENGKTFVTILKGSSSGWRRGEDVHIITVNRAKYIRTDRNQTAADNLGELPEF